MEGRVKAPTRTNGPPLSVRDRGPSNLKRGRQGHRHTVSIAGCHTGRCRDYNPCSRQSPAVRGGDGTSTQPQAQQTSKVGRLKQTSRWGRVKEPTRTRRPPSIPLQQGVWSNLKRGRQGQSHTMSIAGSHKNCCRDYKPSSRQSRGSARRGRYVNPASSTANVQGRKAQTDVPVREKLRSQPGREDHQAHRNSKGSNPP